MKALLKILTFLLIIPAITFGQECNYEIGDIFVLKKNGANLRETPEISSKILANINTKYLGNLSFEILESEYKNGFVHVMVSISSPEILPDIGKLDSLTAWIHSSLIEHMIVYPEGEGYSIDYWSEQIENERLSKIRNECKYSANYDSHSYSQRGIRKYEENDYLGAISDFTQSIKISSSYKYLVRSYAYRAFSKLKLKDYLGAIKDLKTAIESCMPVNNYDKTCDLCKNYGNSAIVISGINYPEICMEELIFKKAMCEAQLKNYTESNKDLNLLIKLNPDYGYAYYLRGQIKDIFKDKTGCCQDLSKAGELGVQEAYTEIEKRCNN